MVDGLAVGDDLPRAPPQGRPRQTRLLVEDAHRAVVGVPGVGVARVPGLQPLAGVVAPAKAVEGRRLVRPEDRRPAAGARGQVGVLRLAGGREEVGVQRTHLVGVHEELWAEPANGVPAGAGLGADARQPVAVHVEEVVVPAPARPAAAVQAPVVEGRRVPGALSVHGEHPLPAVGVHHGVDDHHHPLEQLDHLGVGARRQVPGERHGGVRSRGLVSVDRVGHPGHRRRARQDAVELGGLDSAGIVEPGLVGPNLVQVGDVGRRADGGPDQLASLVGPAVALDVHPGAPPGQVAQVARHLGVGRHPAADRLAERGLGRGDLGIVGRAGEEVDGVLELLRIAPADRSEVLVGLLPEGRRCGREEGEGQGGEHGREDVAVFDHGSGPSRWTRSGSTGHGRRGARRGASGPGEFPVGPAASRRPLAVRR